MLLVLPWRWKYDEPEGVDLHRRKPGSGSLDVVRNALAAGERLFLLCADGAAETSGWLTATDHIALFGGSPLTGENRDDLGPRFPSLMGLYLFPEGPWSTGVVGRVPDWRLATPAELRFMGVGALASDGVDEAEVAGHGGGRVMLLVRCHGWSDGPVEGPEDRIIAAAGAAAAGARGLESPGR
jgi:hypothetical protein